MRKYNAYVDEVCCQQFYVQDFDCVNEVASHNCAIVYDRDTDFGNIGLPPSQRIDLSSLSHLMLEQTEQLYHF
jgi:hypothetical protein